MNSNSTYTSDLALVEALKRGAPPAFESLYRQYFRMVNRQAIDFSVAGLDGEDLFQEVLLVLVRKVRDPNFELTAKLSTLIFAIARNLLLKKADKKTEKPMEEEALFFLAGNRPPEEDPEKREEHEAKLELIASMLDTLEEDCRKVLLLSFFEKCPQSEIAARMGYTEAFVKVKKHRCLEYLRKRAKAHPLFKQP